jgi:uncharacterized repeat protein (TIGR01451 family)
VDVALTGFNFPRCFVNVPYHIIYTNTGTMPTHGEVVFTRQAKCTFVSSNVPPDLVNGTIYTWNYTNLLPGESRTIVLYLTLPGPGTTVTNLVHVTGRDILNNIVTDDESGLTQTTLCAYDPNDKTVIPEGVYAQHYTLMSDTLDFVIRFQNTGNDTAFKVVILDTLNSNILDINSFELIAYSHPVVVDLRTNGRTTFTFDNILLPDSNINEPESHGFVRYRCRIKTGLLNNTILNNRGHIYFDLNPAIVTNTTFNTLVYQIPVGLAENEPEDMVQIMPNPVTENARIVFNNMASDKFTLKIYSVEGKLIYILETTGNNIVVDKNILNKQGMYIYELRNEKGLRNHTGKFVKF